MKSQHYFHKLLDLLKSDYALGFLPCLTLQESCNCQMLRCRSKVHSLFRCCQRNNDDIAPCFDEKCWRNQPLLRLQSFDRELFNEDEEDTNTYIHIYLISSSSKEIQDWYVDQFAEIMQTFQEYNSGYFGFFPSFLRPLIFANRDVYGCRSVVPFNL